MPRVTEEHLTARRRQILDAARRCFHRSGFHRTSMQDILTESELSAGAVYRYFRGKNEIMMAIANEVVTQVIADVSGTLTADPPPAVPEALRAVLTEVDRFLGPDGELRIAVQVWGESMHDTEMAGFVAGAYQRVRGTFRDYAARARDAGHLPADSDPDQVGTVLFGLVPGYILQRALIGDPDLATYVAGLTALVAPAPGADGPTTGLS
ncbi:MAG: TetR/AcrR family transcriptional regulator [Actinocatenispora sp.]